MINVLKRLTVLERFYNLETEMDVLLQFVKNFLMTRFRVVTLENVVSRVGNGQHLKTLMLIDKQKQKKGKINH